MKRILTIQDYSARGRCSLTVALPILSACGVECVGLPTAVLSNHTAFSSFTYHDLTDERLKSVDNWMAYNHHFDRIYTGYLGNGQIPVVTEIIRRLKAKETSVVVDPAFGEGGKLYPGFDIGHVKARKDLASKADLILPNLTEACYRLGIEYRNDYSLAELESIAGKLTAINGKNAILTGIRTGDKVGALIVEGGHLSRYLTKSLPSSFHGGGDTFASALCGCLLQQIDLENAVKISHNFTHRARQDSLDDGIDGKLYGLEFEKELPYLWKQIAKYKNG